MDAWMLNLKTKFYRKTMERNRNIILNTDRELCISDMNYVRQNLPICMCVIYEIETNARNTNPPLINLIL